MNFDHFFEFYKDFSLFPDIINLVQLKNIFFSLTENFSCDSNLKEKTIKCIFLYLIIADNLNASNDLDLFEENEKVLNYKKSKKSEFINYQNFLDSLAMTSLFFKFQEKFSLIDKVFFYLISFSYFIWLKE